MAVRQTWGEDRVFFLDEDGTLKSLPTAWTDVAEPDVFVAMAAGRSPFRVEDLLGARRADRSMSGSAAAAERRVRRTSPWV